MGKEKPHPKIGEFEAHLEKELKKAQTQSERNNVILRWLLIAVELGLRRFIRSRDTEEE